jgi:AcrR family transcriptional regulator
MAICAEGEKYMPENVLDRRVQKTRKLLQDALIDLVSEKGLESVTIQEILDRANVGRSTFYTHFQDKNELLHSCFEELGKLFEQHNAWLLEGNKNHRDSSNFDFILNMFRFVGRNQRLFKALLGTQGIAIFNPPIYDYLFSYMHEALKPAKPDDKRSSLQIEIVAHYFVSAFIGVLRWWVEKDMPCTAEEMDKLFKQLSVTGFKDVLGWS